MRSHINQIAGRRLLLSNQKMQLRSLSRVILVALRAYDSAAASLKLCHVELRISVDLWSAKNSFPILGSRTVEPYI